jgi:processive 1,2-diacylglycerol beta-glucosyltransferase
MAKKVLVLYATAGIGHKKASLAVKQALDEIAPKDAEVTIKDSLDLTNRFFKWAYLKSYLLMVGKLPTFWGMSYYLTDNRYVNIVVSKLRRMNNWLNSGALRKHLVDTKYDVIVSTHFFGSEVIADMKSSGVLRSRLITVVTDYRLHSWWVANGTDMYVVGCEEARGDILRWGVDPSRVKVLGIPAEPIFSKQLDKEAIRQKAGLKKGVPTILVIGGGFGVGPIMGIVRLIKDLPEDLQLLVVCGHNESLVKQLEAVKAGMKHDMHVFGFVQNVYDYMEVADVLISKSGGITVTESLAKDLPLVVIAPIIGQETRNSDFLLANGAARKADKVSDLEGILRDLMDHPEKIKAMREAIGRIRKPNACYDIAKLALEI